MAQARRRRAGVARLASRRERVTESLPLPSPNDILASYTPTIIVLTSANCELSTTVWID